AALDLGPRRDQTSATPDLKILLGIHRLPAFGVVEDRSGIPPLERPIADLLRRDPGRNVWCARLDIPARVRYAFLDKDGQPMRVLVKSLGTSSRVESQATGSPACRPLASPIQEGWRDYRPSSPRGRALAGMAPGHVYRRA